LAWSWRLDPDPRRSRHEDYASTLQWVGGHLDPAIWLGDSLRELKAFPAGVQDEMGYAIYLAQRVEVQKKSRSGIATPKTDVELIRRRPKKAVEISKQKE
jgi:phage-related protein